MHAAWMCVATLVLAVGSSRAGEQPAAAVLRIEADDMQSLQDSLLVLTQERLRPTGLFVDRQRARMSLSSSLPSAQVYEVRPTWRADAQTPVLPLTFELRPISGPERAAALGHVPSVRSIQATLAVPLLREVWVAARRLRKGSAVTCADLNIRRRPFRDVPWVSLALPCEIEPESVALRDIAAGDVMRSVDVGRAPDVTAGAPVRVRVATGGISITTTAVALADARVGDQIDVRLQRPARTLRTRVTGPGWVQPIDGSP